MFNDFKAFLQRGNVLDLAIGVIIGAAFGKIVTTLVEGIIMPPIGYALGGVDFSSLYYDLSGKFNSTDPKVIEEAAKGGAPMIRYGQFINDIIIFLIVAFVMFLLARWAVKLFRSMEADKAPAPEVELLAEIRDILQKKPSV